MQDTRVLDRDTIAAIATAPGKAGVGIIRVSGPLCQLIASRVTGKQLIPRHAHYATFFEYAGDESPTPANAAVVLDTGIALLFPAPHSFTGEDVLELQGHGGPVVLDLLLKTVIALGARMARPGEFSERAYLNNKIDLAQAEAIADLIDSGTEQAARSALRSLQGEFSQHINQFIEQVIELRVYVESAIDFPEEEIDFISEGQVGEKLNALLTRLDTIYQRARQGSLLREGLSVVIAGAPNAGKSSLLNALSGHETAIVTPIEGTTRDVIRTDINIDGVCLHIIDTAGLRQSPDPIEQEGIRRAWQEIRQADRILLVNDSSSNPGVNTAQLWASLIGGDNAPELPALERLTLIHNKCDLSGLAAGELTGGDDAEPDKSRPCVLALSAKTGAGMEQLRQHLRQSLGFEDMAEGNYSARRRHLHALDRARHCLLAGQQQLLRHSAAELLAEDLRRCQHCLAEITGEFSSDDLLGEIFASFCIGK